MNCTNEHERYYSRAQADAALADLIGIAKKSGRGGKSYRRLNVFQCGDHFHVGRSNALPASYGKPAPAPKPPTPGELRRQAQRRQKAAERQRQHLKRLYNCFGDLADLADSIAVAARMVEDYFKRELR
jgi:hypothetical protein